MASGGEMQVSNKQVIFRDYVTGFPKESDMELTTRSITLKLPQGSTGLLLKNLYLSCDPYMRARMTNHRRLSYVDSFKPGSPITGFGVARVLESGYPKFNPGDLVWGFTGWEEYSVITATESLFKIHNTDVPLSYYTALLGAIPLNQPRKGYIFDRWIYETTELGIYMKMKGKWMKEL